MARGGGGKGLFPCLAPSPGVGTKQEGAPSLEALCSGCAGAKLLSHHAGVSLGGHGTLSGCSVPRQSLAALLCALCHLLPSLAARGCVLRAALPRSLLQGWPGPPLAVVPNISYLWLMSCPSAASWLPGLPAACPGSLPSLERLMLEEELAGPGGQGQLAGRGWRAQPMGCYS